MGNPTGASKPKSIGFRNKAAANRFAASYRKQFRGLDTPLEAAAKKESLRQEAAREVGTKQ